MVLFLFLKKRRRNKLSNQNPDFGNGMVTHGDDEEPDASFDDKHQHLYHDNAIENKSRFSWFTSLFGGSYGHGSAGSDSNLLDSGVGGVSGIGAGVGAGVANGMDAAREGGDLEAQNNYGSTSQPGRQFDQPGDESVEDFVYRGVSNSNNLDSVFRSSAATTGGRTSAQMSTRSSSLGHGGSGAGGSTAGHTRMNSFGHPLASPRDFDFHESLPPDGGGQPPINRNLHASQLRPETQSSSRYNSHTEEDSDGDFDYDDDLVLPGEQAPYPRQNVFADQDYGSNNNSMSRFQEDVT